MGERRLRFDMLAAQPMADRDDPRRSSYLTDPAEAPTSSGERVRFVSRSTPEELKAIGEQASAGPYAPKLLEARTLLLFLLAILLQLYSWNRLEGYQLADSVEYMERAHYVASGGQLDPGGAVRSFGFSTLLVPFFAVARWLGQEELLPVIHSVRVFQMLVGLGLVFVCMRIGGRLGGPRVGHAAGLLCAINPIFLQYSVSPVSGLAAAFFIAVALDCLIERASLRRALAGGLALGGAFLMAYQTILIIVPLLGLIFLRDRFKHFRYLAGALVGLALGIGCQVLLDRWSYGVWGISVKNYLIENAGGVMASLLYKIGLEDTQLARDLYTMNLEHLGGSFEDQPDAKPREKLQSFLWYATELHRVLVWPVMAVTVLGLLKCWLQASWKSSILAVLLLVNALGMTLKGSTSFRLWLPLLPMLAPLTAWGWASLRGTELEKPATWRAVVGAAILAGGLWLGLDTLREINTRKYGAYWEAAAFVNEAVARERQVVEAEGDEWIPPRLSSVYNWAVFGRCSEDLDQVKFSDHLYEWGYLDEDQRERMRKEVQICAWLLLHKPVLDIDTARTEVVNDRFELVASFWNEDGDPELGDVRALRNRGGSIPGARDWEGVRPRRFWEVFETMDPEAYRREHQLDRLLPRPLTFQGTRDDGRPQKLHLLGFDYERLPGTGFGWITYHWWTDTGFDREFWVADRVLIRGGSHAWHNSHLHGYGHHPTTDWKVGTLLRESFLLVPGSEPMAEGYRPIGGTWRRGDILPATLWLKTIYFKEDGNKAVGLRAVARGSDKPLKMGFQLPPSHWLVSPEGFIMSRDRMIRVGAFPMSVIPRYRWPDDGNPAPE